ncbi:hypothetical protein ACFW6E_09640 [Streptomyces olivaceoviridis]|uniref:hypothetical protein n=1 Tax=Streptomyces olivaceoviridis TaxID=1921 RepID=UPI0036BBAD69
MDDARPAGPVGAGPYDSGTAAPGRRGAYGGDADARGEEEGAAPVGVRCHRHEGIVVTDRQRVRGLGWPAAYDSAVPGGVVIARNGSAVCAGTGGFTP